MYGSFVYNFNGVMARANKIQEFEMCYQISFDTNIRGHHVYKSIWTPKQEEFLKIRYDAREEAREYGEHALGVYTLETLVCHVPIKFSSLLHHFPDEENHLICQVPRKRKREVGFVIHAKNFAYTKRKRIAETLD